MSDYKFNPLVIFLLFILINVMLTLNQMIIFSPNDES